MSTWQKITPFIGRVKSSNSRELNLDEHTCMTENNMSITFIIEFNIEILNFVKFTALDHKND